MATANEKSCGPQLFKDENYPNSGWILDDLSEYAKSEHQAIAESEESLAASYWRLGLALTLARSHFSRGQWRQYLNELGTEKTRCSKAMAIYRTFPEEQGLAGETVDSAYKQRVRRKRKTDNDGESNDQSGTDQNEHEGDADGGKETLGAFLTRLQQDSEHFVHEAAFVESSNASDMICLLDAAVSALQEIRQQLERQSKQV